MRSMVMIGSFVLVLSLLSIVLNVFLLNWTGIVVTLVGAAAVVVTGVLWYRVAGVRSKR